jgi:hypothetical protein
VTTGTDQCGHRRPGRRADVGCGNPRSALAAADDREIRAKGGQRFGRCQANAVGRTGDQDLLVVHSTAIQGYGHMLPNAAVVAIIVTPD